MISKERCFKISEAAMAVSALVIIIGIFAVPTIYYAVPSGKVEVPNNTISADACTDTQPYSGEICGDILTSLQTCFTGVLSATPPNIPLAVDQGKGETDAKMLIPLLPVFISNSECLNEVKPFLCLHIFKLCDNNNELHTTVRMKCINLRDDVCSDEWTAALSFSTLQEMLPTCEDLPNEIDECIGDVNASNSTVHPDLTTFTEFANERVPECADNFFYDQNETGLCRPECGKFREKGIIVVVVERIAICICLVASAAVIILGLTCQRDTLLTFPSIVFVYLSCNTLVLSAVVIVGFFANTKLFCGQRDQIYSSGLGNETAYCTISGVVTNYSLVQVGIWGLLHSLFLFGALAFPFKYRVLKESGRIHHAHVISVLVAVILPLFSALVPLKDGFLNTRNPGLACVGRNPDYIYYMIVLPLSLLIGTASYLLLLSSWKILKVFVIRKLRRGQKMEIKAEVKMAVVILYYIIVGVMSLMTLTYFEVKSKANRNSLEELFLCKSGGNLDCSNVDLNAINNLDILTVVVMVMISFLPVVAFIFSFDPVACKKAIYRITN